MGPKFLPNFCGYKKNHNSQYSLLKISEIWKQHFDKRDQVGISLMDLSKAFDTFNRSLSLARVEIWFLCKLPQTFTRLLP